MIRTLLLLLVTTFVASASFASEHSLDLWTGTIEAKDDDIYLKRCDLLQHLYLLKALGSEDGFDQIPIGSLKSDSPITVTLIAAYQEGDRGAHVLLVESVDEVIVGESCHLLDFLDLLGE